MANELDLLIPDYVSRSQHRIWIAAPPGQVWAAMLAVALTDLPLARTLLAVRNLPARLMGSPTVRSGRRPLAQLLRDDDRWVTLIEEPGRRLVVGRAARFWELVPTAAPGIGSRSDFLAFSEPGFAKAVISHEIVPDGAGSYLITETRVVGTDARARRVFAAYWQVIRPGVGLIRRSTLKAVSRRCAVLPGRSQTSEAVPAATPPMPRALAARASGLLQLLGVAHAAVGVIKYRSELAAIASDGIFNAVNGHPERLIAFWFLVVAPALWMCGRLLAVAESTGHLKVQVAAGRLLIGLGLVGILAMPTSPFWALGAVGVIALHNGSPRRSPTPETSPKDLELLDGWPS